MVNQKQSTLRGSTLAYNADSQLSGTGYAFDGNPSLNWQSYTCSYDFQDNLMAFGSLFTSGYYDGLQERKQECVCHFRQVCGDGQALRYRP